ncbi:beta-L-arabinofuranosidase domain-containing protein [Microbacterium terrae]|nr:beta-L-arabinofuranosidase domain-containing protein [Microbacterium terrae]
MLQPASVELLAGADLDAERTVRATLSRLDTERLLAPLRREAGLESGDGYGGWEADGLGGHTAGHALSAASMHAARGDDDMRAFAQRLVDGIRECQHAGGSGYVGGVPDGRALWDDLRAGRIDAGAFHLNGRWVPLYNLHKTLAGLVDAAELAAIPGAAEAAAAFGDWWLETCGALDDDAFEQILRTEFGGMPEALARLALLRRDRSLLELARRFVPDVLTTPLAAGRDELDGLHANTQIPVIVGFAVIERAARELAPDLLPEVEAREGAAARTFFDAVAHRRSSAIGGDSVREHFHAASDFLAMFTAREGPETCNTHNMIKLAAELHLLTGEDSYLAWAERARANHLRSAQHPEHGGLVYFTSQRPGHYRVYSPEAEGFWCCMGSGFEAQSRHGALVFTETDREVRVNAFVPAIARTDAATVAVRPLEQTEHGVDRWEIVAEAITRPAGPAEDAGVDGGAGFTPTLSVLIPDWVDGAAVVRAAGAGAERVAAGARWRGALGAVEVELPRASRVERAPDGSAWGWVVDGPDVLAARHPDDTVEYRGNGARMGHLPTAALRPLAATPIVDPDDLGLVRSADGRLRIATDAGAVELEPFAGLHDARYTLAWPLAGAAEIASRRAELAAVDAASLGLEVRTRDSIRFGEQQPESDHALIASDEEIGISGDQRWRRTRGVIEMTLADWSGTAESIRLTWLAGDDAGAALRVVYRGDVVFEAVVGSGPTECIIPVRRTEGEVEIPVRIEAPDGAVTPRLVEVRLLSAAADS